MRVGKKLSEMPLSETRVRIKQKYQKMLRIVLEGLIEGTSQNEVALDLGTNREKLSTDLYRIRSTYINADRAYLYAVAVRPIRIAGSEELAAEVELQAWSAYADFVDDVPLPFNKAPDQLYRRHVAVRDLRSELN